MAKGYSARRGFSNGSGQALKQQQMQQQIMKMQDLLRMGSKFDNFTVK